MNEHRVPIGRFGVVVAARTGSSRLPRKALLPLGGLPMISFLLERIRATQEASSIIFATTTLPEDDELARAVGDAGFPVFRGANEDVVARYVGAAKAYELDYVVRITGDCPFVDAETLDYCLISARQQVPFDLASTKGRFPVGIDYEIYRASVMAALHSSGKLDSADREHLTSFIYHHPDLFRFAVLEPRPEWHTSRSFTVDTPYDYRAAQKIVKRLGHNNFTIAELVGQESNED
jgi:spore coat polysaccharide biosynthesis protein SpsF